jgi:hypothetical protein
MKKTGLVRRRRISHCDLPFDLAQGGELVKPFVICDLLFGIFSHPITPLLQHSSIPSFQHSKNTLPS